MKFSYDAGFSHANSVMQTLTNELKASQVFFFYLTNNDFSHDAHQEKKWDHDSLPMRQDSPEPSMTPQSEPYTGDPSFLDSSMWKDSEQAWKPANKATTTTESCIIRCKNWSVPKRMYSSS